MPSNCNLSKEIFLDESASTSGILNSDVTILSDDASINFVEQVEKELKHKFSVADVVPAGRLKEDNIFSRIKHSKVM